MKENKETSLIVPVTTGFIERRIHLIQKEKVMCDFDLAELYQVTTKALNQAVKRNTNRFPKDFMFQLTDKDILDMNRSQFVTGYQKHRDPHFRPYVFTELGVAMLSSVLNSEHAVQMNIFIMRAFVALRQLLATHVELVAKINALEREQKEQGRDISLISIAISKLVKEKDRLKNAIGFQV